MNTPHTPQTQSQTDDFSLTEEQLSDQIKELDIKGKALSAHAFANSPHYFKRLLRRYIQAKQDIKLLKEYAKDPLPNDQTGDLSEPSLPAKLNNTQIIEQLHSTLKSFHQLFTSRSKLNTHV